MVGPKYVDEGKAAPTWQKGQSHLENRTKERISALRESEGRYAVLQAQKYGRSRRKAPVGTGRLIFNAGYRGKIWQGEGHWKSQNGPQKRGGKGESTSIKGPCKDKQFRRVKQRIRETTRGDKAPGGLARVRSE